MDDEELAKIQQDCEERIRKAKEREAQADRDYEDALRRLVESEKRLKEANERLNNALFAIQMTSLAKDFQSVSVSSKKKDLLQAKRAKVIKKPPNHRQVRLKQTNDLLLNFKL